VYRTAAEARQAFDAYARLEPSLRALWEQCTSAAAPARDKEIEEIDPFEVDAVITSKPDEEWSPEDYFSQHVKSKLLPLVGAHRVEGPPELQSTDAYEAIYDLLITWALSRTRPTLRAARQSAEPPAISRLARTGAYRHRTLRRSPGRERSTKLRRQVPIEVLLGRLIQRHGLTDEVRSRFVCLYWTEIAGDQIASRTFPISFADGVLHVEASSSTWVHEMRFHRAQLIAQINHWIETNRVWLGPPPLVSDMRFALAMRQREPLVDREHARNLRLHRLQRAIPRTDAAPPDVSDAEREAIRAETSVIADANLRDVIESVRMKWNR
jgi:predicted nucleic acid-binding Zn ribbon protein